MTSKMSLLITALIGPMLFIPLNMRQECKLKHESNLRDILIKKKIRNNLFYMDNETSTKKRYGRVPGYGKVYREFNKLVEV